MPVTLTARWRPGLLVVSLLLAACSAQGVRTGGVDSASCAGPYAETTPRQAQPGEQVAVLSDFHLDECHDTGQPTPATALRDLPVRFTQSGITVELGRVDATGPTGRLRTTVRVPASAGAGLAELTVGESTPALVLVGDGAGGFPPWSGPPKGPFPLTVELRSLPVPAAGGHVVVTATSVDVGVPDDRKHVRVVQPLGVGQVELGPLPPAYWMVRVSVHACAAPGCAAPALQGPGEGACETEARVEDRPVLMRLTWTDLEWQACELRGVERPRVDERRRAGRPARQPAQRSSSRATTSAAVFAPSSSTSRWVTSRTLRGPTTDMNTPCSRAAAASEGPS